MADLIAPTKEVRMNKSAMILTLLGTLALEAVAESADAPSEDDLSYFDATDLPSGVEVQKLVKITSDQDDKVVEMSAMIQNGNLAGVVGASPGARAEPFWLKDIEKNSGVVLYEQKGYEVLKLKGKLSRATQEGKLIISYLTNGLFGSYKSCDVYVKHSGAGWILLNAYTRKPIKEVRLKVGTMGVSTIMGLCPATSNAQ